MKNCAASRWGMSTTSHRFAAVLHRVRGCSSAGRVFSQSTHTSGGLSIFNAVAACLSQRPPPLDANENCPGPYAHLRFGRSHSVIYPILPYRVAGIGTSAADCDFSGRRGSTFVALVSRLHARVLLGTMRAPFALLSAAPDKWDLVDQRDLLELETPVTQQKNTPAGN